MEKLIHPNCGAWEQEIERLKEENERLKKENESLKKENINKTYEAFDYQSGKSLER